MKKRMFWCACLLFLGAANQLHLFAQDNISPTVVKCTYLLRIAELVEWPNENSLEKFRIVLFSDDTTFHHVLHRLTAERSMKQKPIEIVTQKDVGQLSSAQLVFIGKDHCSDISTFVDRILGKPVLLVTDNCPSSDKIMVNFTDPTQSNASVGFEIDEENIHAHNLQFMPELLTLGQTRADEVEMIRLAEELLKKEHEVVKKQQNALITTIAFLFLLLSLGTITFYAYRINRAMRIKLEEKNKIIENQNKELQEKTIKLEAANKELESFSYSVSHDLRAPLRSILGFNEAIEQDFGQDLNEGARDFLRRIRSSGEKMNGLIDNLLKFSQVMQQTIILESVNLSTMARAILAELQESDRGRNVEIYVENNIVVWGDRNLLLIALGNLLNNAWKFTSKTHDARIEFIKSEIDGVTVCCVRDNGVGFDMQYKDKLFGAFQRLHNAKDFPGTGIGLATVHRIIQRHGGFIRAESEPGRGATFYFFIPLVESREPSRIASSQVGGDAWISQ